VGHRSKDISIKSDVHQGATSGHRRKYIESILRPPGQPPLQETKLLKEPGQRETGLKNKKLEMMQRRNVEILSKENDGLPLKD
jgi:hypothetical protein